MPGRSIFRMNLLNLGYMKYTDTWKIQKHLQKIIMSKDDFCNTLILVQHDPVYTLGLREKISKEEETRLNKLGADVISSDRGGLTTFHGPGQLVAYPIVHLDRQPKCSLKTFVSRLEDVAVHTCRLFGLPALVNPMDVSHTGAWVNDNKICAIGVNCRRHVTTHGLALNCNVDLKWFSHIVPCGIKDKGVTSISRELERNVSVEEVISPFLVKFQSIFRCSLQSITLEEIELDSSSTEVIVSQHTM